MTYDRRGMEKAQQKAVESLPEDQKTEESKKNIQEFYNWLKYEI